MAHRKPLAPQQKPQLRMHISTAQQEAGSMPSSVTVILSPYHAGNRDQGAGAGLSVDDFEGEIGRSFELMRRIAAAVRAAGKMSSLPIVLAGNCFSSIGVCAGLDDTDRGYLGMIWHDAHDDCHTPDTLEGGYFDAMGDPMLTGVSWRALVDSIPGFHALNRDNVIFCGVRDVTAIERQRLIDAGFKIVWGPSLTMRHTSTLLQS